MQPKFFYALNKWFSSIYNNVCFVIGSLNGAHKKEREYRYRSDIDRYSTDIESARKVIKKSKIQQKKKTTECYDDVVPPTLPHMQYKKIKNFHERCMNFFFF